MKENNARPIFIVGMNGSGTTMLADCLNHHPDIYFHKIESRVIPYYYYNIKKYGNINESDKFKKLLEDFSNNSAFTLRNNSKRVEIPVDIDKIDNKSLARAIDITFLHFAAKTDKEIWGDHSPKYAAFILELLDLFPKAKIIHIIRDGRDCAYSFARRFGQNIYLGITTWKQLVQKAKLDGAKIGSSAYFEVKYEEITNHPELYMKKICAFLDVPFDRRVLASKMPTLDVTIKKSLGEKANTIIPNSGKWLQFLTEKQIRKMEEIAGSTLEESGYATMFTAGNHDIFIGKLLFWKLTDKINALIAFHKVFKGRSNLGTYFRAVKTSLRQSKALKKKF